LFQVLNNLIYNIYTDRGTDNSNEILLSVTEMSCVDESAELYQCDDVRVCVTLVSQW